VIGFNGVQAGNPKKVDHLVKLDGAKERLQLFKADLLEEGSFDSAVEGCHGVFHTASPVRFIVNDPQVRSIFILGLIHPTKPVCKVRDAIHYKFFTGIIYLFDV